MIHSWENTGLRHFLYRMKKNLKIKRKRKSPNGIYLPFTIYLFCTCVKMSSTPCYCSRWKQLNVLLYGPERSNFHQIKIKILISQKDVFCNWFLLWFFSVFVSFRLLKFGVFKVFNKLKLFFSSFVCRGVFRTLSNI